jgi:OmpA-OmpF porin, OOP family
MRNNLFLFFLLFAGSVFSQAKWYNDGHGKMVKIPLGDVAFADEVVSFTMGFPPSVARDSSMALGPPDYDGGSGNFVSLGCGGSIVLRFRDNCIRDVEGPDIFVFELGKYVESTNIQISEDLQTWIDLGDIGGGQVSVDIAGKVKPGQVFSYIKLTDLKNACSRSDSWPGADIDAVAAIGSGFRFFLNCEVLFDPGKWDLKPAGENDLEKLLRFLGNIKPGSIRLEGHTDSDGSDTFNQKLSEKRAASIEQWLTGKALSEWKLASLGYGKTRPVADNLTKEGKQKNRRVEVIIIPGD